MISPEWGEIAMTTAMKLRQEDAKKMLLRGYPMDDIIDITGLSRDEIQKL